MDPGVLASQAVPQAKRSLQEGSSSCCSQAARPRQGREGLHPHRAPGRHSDHRHPRRDRPSGVPRPACRRARTPSAKSNARKLVSPHARSCFVETNEDYALRLAGEPSTSSTAGLRQPRGRDVTSAPASRAHGHRADVEARRTSRREDRRPRSERTCSRATAAATRTAVASLGARWSRARREIGAEPEDDGPDHYGSPIGAPISPTARTASLSDAKGIPHRRGRAHEARLSCIEAAG